MRPQSVVDVSQLPALTFGPKNVTWWGTLAFIILEGTTLLVTIVAYLYLRQNFDAWPPPPTPLPDLGIATVNTILILAVIYPMWRADHAAKRLDVAGVRRWMVTATALTAVAVVLRYFEFEALNTRFDEHAYGSVLWAILVLHTTLLFVDLLESGLIAALFVIGPLEEKHFTDASDAAFYQYFLSLSALVVYLVAFVSPRWLG